jgi:hypothetical protein
MAKRRRIALESQPAELVEREQDESPPPLETEQPANAVSLADMRNEVLRHRTELSHTIADLEAWKAEIECTLAFLRAKV